jgi:TolB protein
MRSETLEFGPAWSPDGRRIAFMTLMDGVPDVYVMNADGSAKRNLTRSPRRFDVLVGWAPAPT